MPTSKEIINNSKGSKLAFLSNNTLNKAKKKFTNLELKKIYQILNAFNKDLIVNPSEDWELDHYDEQIADKKGLAKILSKIEFMLPEKELDVINKNILRRKYDIFNNDVDERVYEKIEKALNNRKTIEIGYFDMEKAEVVKRQIDIYHKTRKYVIGYCHLRKAMRKFRTSRITSTELTNKIYEIPNNFDKNKY